MYNGPKTPTISSTYLKATKVLSMVSPQDGSSRIGSAADLIHEVFGHRIESAAAPDLSLAFEFSGQLVQLDIYGPTAASHLGGVFRHLIAGESSKRPALHIRFAALREAEMPQLRLLAVPSPGLIACDPDGPLLVELHGELAIAFDRAAQRVTAIAGDLACLPSAHLSHPFAHALGWLAAQNQAYVTHGAAIGRDGRGLLFAGKGGQGKSTTALACAAAGWNFAGDDFVMLDRGHTGGYTAHSLYATGRLHPAQAERFPSLAAGWDRALSPEDNKLTLFPRDGAVSLTRRLSIEAIVLPMVDAQRAGEIAPLSRAAALHALMADSVRIYPWITRERAQFYATAVEELPCYILYQGPDIAAIPAAVARTLDRAIAAGNAARRH